MLGFILFSPNFAYIFFNVSALRFQTSRSCMINSSRSCNFNLFLKCPLFSRLNSDMRISNASTWFSILSVAETWLASNANVWIICIKSLTSISSGCVVFESMNEYCDMSMLSTIFAHICLSLLLSCSFSSLSASIVWTRSSTFLCNSLLPAWDAADPALGLGEPDLELDFDMTKRRVCFCQMWLTNEKHLFHCSVNHSKTSIYICIEEEFSIFRIKYKNF